MRASLRCSGASGSNLSPCDKSAPTVSPGQKAERRHPMHPSLRAAIGLFLVVSCGGRAVLVRQGAQPLRETVVVGDVAALLANIGRDDVELVLAPGRYVIPACAGG